MKIGEKGTHTQTKIRSHALNHTASSKPQAWISEVSKEYEQQLTTAFDNAPEYQDKKPEYFGSHWSRHLRYLNYANPKETGVEVDSLKQIGRVRMLHRIMWLFFLGGGAGLDWDAWKGGTQ